MTTGVENVKDLAFKMRKSIANEAAGSAVGTAPETRVNSFTNAGELSMGFTQPLDIPIYIEELIKQQTTDNRRRLENGEAPEIPLISVYAVKEYISEADELLDPALALPIMSGWELLSLTADGFDLKMDFTDPIMISSGDEPDLLLIQLNLS